MLQWIGQNSQALNVVVNTAMLIVWLTYLQLFLMSYMRQRRSHLLINRGAGDGVESRCLISNMSAEPVYIQSIMAVLKKGDNAWTAPVTDFDDTRGDQVDHVSEATNQGPLGVGEFIDVGTFAKLAERTARFAGASGEEVEQTFDAMELTVVAAHASEALPVAARREFALGDDGALTPLTITSEQIRAHHKRREVTRYMRKFL